MRKIWCGLMAAAWAGVLGVGTSAQDLPALDADQLRVTLDRLLEDHPAARRTNLALKVVDLESGQVLYDLHGDKLFTPASNLKIYTSAAALALLGPEHRWTTTVGLIEPSPGEGGPVTVVLTGGGDPMLDADELRAIADEVAAHPSVRGSEVVVRVAPRAGWEAVPLKGPGWMWDDDPDDYNMSIQPLMLNFNVAKFTATPGPTVGSPVKISVEPPVREGTAEAPSPYAPVGGVTGDAGTKDTLQLDRASFSRQFTAVGELAIDAKKPREFGLAVHDPSLWIADVFGQMLAERGVAIVEDAQAVDQGPADSAAQILVEHQGKTAAEAVQHFLRKSENAVGEMLLLTLAERFGDRVSWPAGAGVITRWLINEAGLEPGSFRLVDGSGLSRYSLISADSSIRLLTFMRTQATYEDFFAGLPRYKVVQPVWSRFGGVPWIEFDAERVFAKPGGMSGVSTISGYVQTLDGRWLVFSLLGNGYTGSSRPVRNLRDRVWSQLVCYRPAEAAVPSE